MDGVTWKIFNLRLHSTADAQTGIRIFLRTCARALCVSAAERAHIKIRSQKSSAALDVFVDYILLIILRLQSLSRTKVRMEDKEGRKGEGKKDIFFDFPRHDSL
jgi:hypothetical protein